MTPVQVAARPSGAALLSLVVEVAPPDSLPLQSLCALASTCRSLRAPAAARTLELARLDVPARLGAATLIAASRRARALRVTSSTARDVEAVLRRAAAAAGGRAATSLESLCVRGLEDVVGARGMCEALSRFRGVAELALHAVGGTRWYLQLDDLAGLERLRDLSVVACDSYVLFGKSRSLFERLERLEVRAMASDVRRGGQLRLPAAESLVLAVPAGSDESEEEAVPLVAPRLRRLHLALEEGDDDDMHLAIAMVVPSVTRLELRCDSGQHRRLSQMFAHPSLRGLSEVAVEFSHVYYDTDLLLDAPTCPGSTSFEFWSTDSEDHPFDVRIAGDGGAELASRVRVYAPGTLSITFPGVPGGPPPRRG